MNDQEILDRAERAARSIVGPDDAYEALLRRRDRKRRNQRITAGVVGMAVFVATVWLVTSGGPLDRTQTPVVPGGATAGPTETLSAYPDANSLTDHLLDLKTGERTPLPEEIRGDWFNGYAVSPDGSEVAYYEVAYPPEYESHAPREGAERALFVANIDGTHVRQIADDASFDWVVYPLDMGPAWSPDGTKIAYVGRPSRDVESNIFVVDLASGENTQVTFETVPVSGTAFSPDGSSIVYTAFPPGGSEVRIAPATGGEGSTLVGGHGTSASGASFSPDGSLLSYICADPASRGGSPQENWDLCLANADGSDPRVGAQPEGLHSGIVTASWSPDGSRLAYWTFFGVEAVYVLDLATGQTTRVASGSGRYVAAWPGWLDDRTLFIESYHGPH